MKPLAFLIIGIVVGAPAYLAERILFTLDIEFIPKTSLWHMPLMILTSVLVFAGVILGIIGVWKLWNARKAKTDPTYVHWGPVSMTRQTIYAIIPILDLYAAYKIKKFWALFLILVAFGTLLGTAFSMLEELGLNYPNGMILPIPIEILVTVFLIREWSKRWNNKFQSVVQS